MSRALELVSRAVAAVARRRTRLMTVAGATWAATGLAVVATVVMARGLGVERYGDVVLAIAVVTTVATLLDLTLEDALVFHGSRALAADDLGLLRSLVRTAVVLDVVLGVTVFTVLEITAGRLADVVGPDQFDAGLIRVAAVAVLAQTVDGTTGALLLLAGRPDVHGLAGAATALFRVTAVVATFGRGPTAVLTALAVASCAGAALRAVAAARLVRREWRPGTYGSVRSTSWRSLLRFGVHSSITTAVQAGRSGFVPLALARAAGTHELALFRVAEFPTTIAAVASAPFRLSAYPEQARLSAIGAGSELANGVRGYVSRSLIVGIPAAILLFVAMPTIVDVLYTDEFAGAVGPARIMLIAAVAHSTVVWAKNLPPAIGRPALRTAGTAFEFVVVLLFIVVLRERGATGAAIGVAVAATLFSSWWIWLGPRLARRAAE